MTDEQLATAIPRMDQAAYLAGLQAVAKRENVRMRERAGLGVTTRPEATMRAERQERIKAAQEAILPHLPEEGTATISEIAQSMGCRAGTLYSRLTMLAAEGLVTRHETPEGTRLPVRWERVS